MNDKTKYILETRAAQILAQTSRALQPEYVLLWVVDQEGNEVKHEFIEMKDALVMVDSYFKPPSAKQTRVMEEL